MTLIAITVIAAFALYVMKPDERRALIRAVVAAAARLASAAPRSRRQRDEFEEALRARTAQVLIVPALVAYNTFVFAALIVTGLVGNPDTLIAWGANFGPRTTNVEWGRLFDSMFLHGSLLHFAVTVAGLVQAGLVMERLVGYLTFSVVFATAGFFASAVNLWLYPMDIGIGSSGAVFGIYGFLAGTCIIGLHRPSGVTIPLRTLGRLAPAAALFTLYNVFDAGLRFEAEIAGFSAGLVAGLVLTGDVAERKPAPRRVLASVAATFALAASVAISLHGLTDVRPEIDWIVRLETGTAARYQLAVERFRRGVINARELATVIEENIIPELRFASGRLTTLGRVPREHQDLVARAQEFLRLRDTSWRLRVEALHEGNTAILREADRIETTSLQTLESLKPAVRQ